MELKQILKLQNCEKRSLWTKIDTWRPLRQKVVQHVFPDNFREEVVIPAARDVETFIEKLINEAYEEGKKYATSN